MAPTAYVLIKAGLGSELEVAKIKEVKEVVSLTNIYDTSKSKDSFSMIARAEVEDEGIIAETGVKIGSLKGVEKYRTLMGLDVFKRDEKGKVLRQKLP